MNHDTKESLNAVFGIVAESTPPQDAALTSSVTVLPPESTEPTPAPQTIHEIRAEEDFLFSRTSLKNLATDGSSVLRRAIDAAEQTDRASNYEAVAALMRAAVDTHRAIQDLHKTSQELRIATQVSQAPHAASVHIEQGVVFNGTGDELLRILDKSRQ